ncbi:hypothetical protein WUBG_17439 [Wuchereria bancrofti]|uniref:Uncharacterized protein n=1 Tax=Wuchereria bancrofti TaxID=6293 RepID=J9ACE7_WUCBA|nr:hypothetical protein WUBG_17439 [Wuchereria bancrofti]VDM20550.1 unnamed protein product [Wuchereria bancrofti]
MHRNEPNKSKKTFTTKLLSGSSIKYHMQIIYFKSKQTQENVTRTKPTTNKIAYMMKLNFEIIHAPTMTTCDDIIVATISKIIEGSFLFQEFSGHPELFMSKISTLKCM